MLAQALRFISYSHSHCIKIISNGQQKVAEIVQFLHYEFGFGLIYLFIVILRRFMNRISKLDERNVFNKFVCDFSSDKIIDTSSDFLNKTDTANHRSLLELLIETSRVN
jgi:hypothetical protein